MAGDGIIHDSNDESKNSGNRLEELEAAGGAMGRRPVSDELDKSINGWSGAISVIAGQLLLIRKLLISRRG